MGVADQAFPESIDEILAMVRETPRGRWFLEGYEKRLRTTETERILASIAKLESHIQTLSAGGSDQGLLQKARDAIAAAKRDIAALEQKPAELSAEGQLFAKLAALSRQSFTGPPAVSKGVERALRLVSDLDQQLAPATGASPAPVAASIKPDLFKQDEAIFEPAPTTAPLVTTRRNDGGEALPRGAKLVIQHKASPAKPVAEEAAPAPASAASAAATPTIEAAPPAIVAAEPPPVFASATPGPATEAAPELHHSRIVIIRRKAEEMETVPLLDAAAEAAPASPASAA